MAHTCIGSSVISHSRHDVPVLVPSTTLSSSLVPRHGRRRHVSRDRISTRCAAAVPARTVPGTRILYCTLYR